MDQENQTQSERLDKAKAPLASFLLKTKIKLKRIVKKATKPLNPDHDNLNKKLVYRLSRSKIPNRSQLKYFKKVLTPKENKAINILLIFILINIVIFLGISYYKGVDTVPAFGGQYQEGLVGLPRYINPLYSFSDVDSDITSLVFSSLFKFNGKGDLALDLVKNYSVSGDGKIYNIEIRDDVKWHDGEKLTADDVVFTFQAILNPDFRSPWLAVFQGVEVEKTDDYNLRISLSEAYAGFTELLSFGILPQHLWQNINPATANLAELNLKPIGSGVYEFKSLFKNKVGEIKSYNLEANEDYYEKTPYIKDLVFKFYPDFNSLISALNSDEVDGISYLAPGFEDDIVAINSLNLHQLLLSQVNALFFNQSENEALESLELRQALALGLNKEMLVEEVLKDKAQRAKGPIYKSSFAYKEDLNPYSYNQEEAKKLLESANWKLQKITQEDIEKMQAIENNNNQEEASEDASEETENDTSNEESLSVAGWSQIKGLSASAGLEIAGKWRYKEGDEKRQYLVVTLTVPQEELSLQVAKKIKNDWQELGIRTIINEIGMESIQTDIIENKNFEIVLYGEMLGFNPAPYVYWHSDERLNLSGYSNVEVDKLLEELRVSLSSEERMQKYSLLQEKINQELPAIFLYSPFYIYPQNKKIKNLDTNTIIEPKDRLANISNWYIKTKNKLSFSNLFK
ncbi:MAG: peptide ABC transporter substrate-binding protein [Candidatus Pacebacteria bacterium]|nr:peptide ABC transporter substrate-binding protein [Candidatus Paceibacterota bacterium]